MCVRVCVCVCVCVYRGVSTGRILATNFPTSGSQAKAVFYMLDSDGMRWLVVKYHLIVYDPSLPFQRVVHQRVLPALTGEFRNPKMIPFILPLVLLIAEDCTMHEYATLIFPILIPALQVQDPIQVGLGPSLGRPRTQGCYINPAMSRVPTCTSCDFTLSHSSSLKGLGAFHCLILAANLLLISFHSCRLPHLYLTSLQVPIIFLQKMDLLLKKTSPDDVKRYILPMIITSLEADNSQLQVGQL